MSTVTGELLKSPVTVIMYNNDELARAWSLADERNVTASRRDGLHDEM